MLGNFGYGLYLVGRKLSELRQSSERVASEVGRDKPIPDHILARMADIPRGLRELVAQQFHGTTATISELIPSVAAQIERLAAAIEKKATCGEFIHIAQSLEERFEDDLKQHLFFWISPLEIQNIRNSVPFGQAVDKAFPKASEDIAEASLCLLLGRFTASVFHLMRAMEGAVQALSQELEIANVEREWGKLLSDIGTKIEAMPKGDRRNAWSENHSLLYHVKQAWRNDTMHPKQTYTKEEAGRVFSAVQSFMRNLALLMEA
jgi:HEPN domain-containing protein